MSDRRPRIIILSDYGHINGGAARVAIASARGLAERGWRVVFACAVAPIEEEIAKAGVDVRHIPITDVWQERSALRAAGRAIWNLSAAAQLRRILAEGEPSATLVHAHQWTRALSPSCLMAARLYGAPLVVTLHDYFASCPNGLFFDFSTGQRCTRTPLSASCVMADCDRGGRAHKAVRVARQLITRSIWRSRGALTFAHVSHFACDRTRRFLPSEAQHVVLLNPCFIERAPPVSVAANRPVAYIGRLTIEKGIRQLVEAARRTCTPLLIQGDGPLRGEIETLGELVTLLPWSGPMSVLATLEQARAAILPSLWEETGTLGAYEALARGVPVIASRSTPAAAVVEEAGGGLVVPSHDVDALGAAMRRVADNAEVAALGAMAYSHYWRAPRDLDSHLNALEQLYRDAWAAGEPAGAAPMPVPASDRRRTA